MSRRHSKNYDDSFIHFDLVCRRGHRLIRYGLVILVML